MDCLIHPTYFPNIAHFVTMIHGDVVYFEVCDNYQKQSYRNRTEIYGANGKLALTVPVRFSQKQRQVYKDVKIAYDDKWQLQHLKSLQSAYRMSPFFEYYIDDLMPIFETTYDYILDLNLNCFEILREQLQTEISTSKTTSFEKTPLDKVDYRALTSRNHRISSLGKYTQVFTEKHGFIPNLSILDLLFNEGPNTAMYLEQQVINP